MKTKFFVIILILLIFLVSCLEKNKEQKPKVKTSDWYKEEILYSKIKRIQKSQIEKTEKENGEYLFYFSAKIYILGDSFLVRPILSSEDTILVLWEQLDTNSIAYYQNREVILIENEKGDKIWEKQFRRKINR